MCLLVQCLVHQLAWSTELRCSIAELVCFWFCGEESDEPLTPCRDRVPGHDFAFMIADGYDMLVGHVKRILERTDDLTWPGQVDLYVNRPITHLKRSMCSWRLTQVRCVYSSRLSGTRLGSRNTATQHLYCFVSSIYQGADRRDSPRYVELHTPASKSSSLVF
ncbi:hypothetical protein JG688_00007720 [Phytophthora aleatoria]|uniref:Uncharacterized protein n=1 Tax=Phytophthora aleatoria TaxID=2496075 RepID=A0A8J5IZC5_9STRA|nr:hypothetical protein JG688_00007720 [Phytophthora aleatoria]